MYNQWLHITMTKVYELLWITSWNDEIFCWCDSHKLQGLSRNFLTFARTILACADDFLTFAASFLKGNWSEKRFFDIMDTKWRWVTLHTQFFYFRPRWAATSLQTFCMCESHRSEELILLLITVTVPNYYANFCTHARLGLRARCTHRDKLPRVLRKSGA